MASHNYAYQHYDAEHMARAVGRDLSISTKQSIEICRFLRNRSVQKAKSILHDVMSKKLAVPATIFRGGASHRPGKIAGGRYPINAAAAILSIIENAEANAQQKGLNTGNLVLVHFCAQKAGEPYHPGRFRGRKMKRSHVEVVLGEQAQKTDEKKPARDKKKKETTEKAS